MENKYIAVSYRLETERNGECELREVATSDRPFEFISGMGMALDDFESQVANLKQGDKFCFSLQPEQAYGLHLAEYVQPLPAHVFEIDGRIDPKYIHVDAVVPLQNAEGERFNGTIVKITPEQITVDLNHPLAGMTLHFDGIVEVSRPATIQEMADAAKSMSGCGGCGGCGSEGGCGGCNGCGGCGSEA